MKRTKRKRLQITDNQYLPNEAFIKFFLLRGRTIKLKWTTSLLVSFITKNNNTLEMKI